ncbi:MAG: hypothetical protein DWQ34_24715 [Planctomycetota bacterium]|nr:MAG: hypothetical protein DWQ34_24715 [Planctomycetota bacterium]REK23052.1 MAG: hypothetical protein DWQ41_17925 [Planctomycetota bacterium]REK34068.1 MAG: hypothetical protein DWQ45_13955 [Planctomycetota bacterium]
MDDHKGTKNTKKFSMSLRSRLLAGAASPLRFYSLPVGLRAEAALGLFVFFVAIFRGFRAFRGCSLI